MQSMLCVLGIKRRSWTLSFEGPFCKPWTLRWQGGMSALDIYVRLDIIEAKPIIRHANVKPITSLERDMFWGNMISVELNAWGVNDQSFKVTWLSSAIGHKRREEAGLRFGLWYKDGCLSNYQMMSTDNIYACIFLRKWYNVKIGNYLLFKPCNLWLFK